MIRDWQSINRHYPTILTIRRANLPVSRLPLSPLVQNSTSAFFRRRRIEGRHVPFSRRDRISCIYLRFLSQPPS